MSFKRSGSPNKCGHRDARHAAAELAALQASRQPQAQQGGGENTARAFIEWCKAQPEDRVPVSIDEALNEFEAALATKEPK